MATAKEKRVIAAAKKAASDALRITPQEAHNTLQLLNRVQVTGIQESLVLGHLAQKYNAIKGSYEAPNDDQDTPGTD